MKKYWDNLLKLSQRKSVFNKIIAKENNEYSERLNEAMIQAIWNDYSANKFFFTTDDLRVEILECGKWNDEKGPDFRNAKIKINEKILIGDVEIHYEANDWFLHQHQKDDEYNNVILHVVWSVNKPVGKIPDLLTIELVNQLSNEILEKVNPEKIANYAANQKFPPCFLAPFLLIKNDREVMNFFTIAAEIRFSEKVQNLKESLRKIGLRNTLIFGIADVLGYKNNREQFLQFTENLLLNDAIENRAKIWGISGLLPDPTINEIAPELLEMVNELWQNWWFQRPEEMPEIKWSFLGRPQNSPFRRVAAFCQILENKANFDNIINSFFLPISTDSINNWCSYLTFKSDIFADYINFCSKLGQKSPLLGSTRIDALIVNLFLPLYAAFTNKEQESNRALIYFCEFSCLEKNHLIKEATTRFFIPPARAKKIVKNNGVQQGMMHLIKIIDQNNKENFKELLRELTETEHG